MKKTDKKIIEQNFRDFVNTYKKEFWVSYKYFSNKLWYKKRNFYTFMQWKIGLWSKRIELVKELLKNNEKSLDFKK